MNSLDSSYQPPESISDLLDNATNYIEIMRQTKDDELLPNMLRQYRWNYFRNTNLTKVQLRAIALFTVDKTYRFIAELKLKDKYTWAYFAKVICYIWESIQDRGVDTFYILDNELNVERFEVTVELFSLTGAAVITPYKDDGSLRSSEEVQKELKICLAQTRNIIYIEKDDEVNYLDDVKELACETNYFVLFRNNAPNNPNLEILK